MKGYGDYLVGVGVSTVGLQDSMATEGLDDICLAVSLSKRLPDELEIPSIYQDMPVYTKVTGRLKAQ